MLLLNNPADDSYTVNKDRPNLLLATNIGLDKPYELGQHAITALHPLFASARQSHARIAHARRRTLLNTWRAHLKDYAEKSTVPIVLKRSWFWYGLSDDSNGL